MTRSWRRWLLASSVVSVSLLLATCGPSGMEMIGDAMVDAADAVRDAGRDAAEIARDTGADVLEDTGEIIRDSAPDDAAAAQDFCGTCTATGSVHEVSAADDPTRHLGGSGWTDSGRGMELATGPLYVSDVVVGSMNLPGLGGSGAVLLFTVADTAFCDSFSGFDAGLANLTYPVPAGIQLLTTATSPAPVVGARHWVPAGRRLCAQGYDTTASRPIALLSWSGFRPYD